MEIDQVREITPHGNRNGEEELNKNWESSPVEEIESAPLYENNGTVITIFFVILGALILIFIFIVRIMEIS